MNIPAQSILVVDDTPANLRLLTRILKDRGYMVRPVPDGALALSAARAEPPDLILLDIMMPGMSGYEVCGELKSDDRTRDIPVIFLSAKSDVADKVKAFTSGGLDYITKPYQAEEVIARVETHLELRRLQKQLEERNQDLTDTLEQLKTTRDQMIHREKMAALGSLIAGVAHEINTPLGAIRASISNVSHAVDTALRDLPPLFDTLSDERRSAFMELVQTAIDNTERLSSRESRKARKQMENELAGLGIAGADTLAATLVNMGICRDIKPALPLIKEPDSSDLLQAAYNLFMLQNNSRNIETAVERASNVVLALKRYARFDASGEKIKAGIPEGIEVVMTLYYHQLKQGIEVSTTYEDVPEISCYPDELNQVWTNIVHNAIQAMDGKGRLDVEVSRLDRHIQARFTDSGCGIPPDILDRIYDPFFTTKGAGEGTGLGLNIVRRVIDHHQGRIEVESRPGKTVFTILLPIDKD